MAVTIALTNDNNHSISSTKKILSRQGELGEQITFSVPTAFAATYGLAWIMVQQPDGQIYYIDNGSGTGFDHATTDSFTYTIGDRDTMLSVEGTLRLQVVLRDDVPPAQAVEWRSRILELTVEGSILSNTDSGGSLIDSLSSGTLDRLADIQYDSLGDGDLLYRDTTTGKWRNVTLVEGVHITATLDKSAGTLTLSASGDLSALAEDVTLADVAGNFTAEEVESALAELFDETVKNTGNETIAGIKTFSSSPIVPTPTTDYQASTKKYVDDKTSLLAEYEVAGSAVTSIDFTGLDINTHKSYRIELECINSSVSAMLLAMYANADTTATNYYSQEFFASSTTVGGLRENAATVGNIYASTSTAVFINLAMVNGYLFAQAQSNEKMGSGIVVKSKAWQKVATVANLTQLTFTSSVASAIGIGSKVRIYRGDV